MKNVTLSLILIACILTHVSAGLTGYWDFEPGNPLENQVGANTPGTFAPGNGALTGAPGGEGVSGFSQDSYTGDGTSQTYFNTNVTGATLGITGSGPKTFVAWINSGTAGVWNDNNRHGIWSYGPSSGSGAGQDLRLLIDEDAGGLRFEVNSGFSAINQTGLDDGNWHMTALVINSGDGVHDVQFYLNGSFVSIDSQSGSNTLINAAADTSGEGTPGTGSLDFIIGGDHRSDNPLPGVSPDGLNTMNGLIDGVRVYDSALTKSELDALYSIPEPGTLWLVGLFAGSLFVVKRRRS